MTLMRDIEWEACFLEPRSDPEFARRFVRETGRAQGGARYFSGIPWVADLMIELSVELERRVALDADLADFVGLVVSQDNSCRFCFAAARAFLRLLGVPERRIARLEQDLLTADFDARERAALDFARRVSRLNPPPGRDDFDALREVGFDELEVVELVGVVALHIFFNRLSTLCALPPEVMEELPDRWGMRLLRPLVALRLRRVRRRSPAVPLEPHEREGPFAALVLPLDRLPAARTLRRTLDGMWASELLARRTKALVFAVVARALGCPVAEQEAMPLLAAEGLAAERVEEVLAHLDAPELDELERVAFPFARETVWYQPARIQRRAREVKQALGDERFIELVAVASLANALCRVGCLAAPRG